jgi:hypothetical protein
MTNVLILGKFMYQIGILLYVNLDKSIISNLGKMIYSVISYLLVGCIAMRKATSLKLFVLNGP